MLIMSLQVRILCMKVSMGTKKVYFDSIIVVRYHVMLQKKTTARGLINGVNLNVKVKVQFST